MDAMEPEGAMTREEERRAAQLARAASGEELELGDPAAPPLAPDALARVEGGEPFVVASISGGLTARVFRLRLGGRDWTLKRARVPALVQNVDGQTSFLNELQRRAELAALKRAPGGAARLAGIVDTQYASLRRGVLLSPWIEGEPVAQWDERRLRQLFDLLVELVLDGLFEWDLCPGNILDDGRQLRLFDFGYMYRFEPLRELNSSGLDAPRFHPAERFETRNHSGFLLWLEGTVGMAGALRAYRLEKEIAAEAYGRLRATLAARGAERVVLDALASHLARWRSGLAGELEPLYLAECWRSHRLDVADDLHGRSCTPGTLARLAWLDRAVGERFGDLRAMGALFDEDAARTADGMSQALAAERADALRWQVAG